MAVPATSTLRDMYEPGNPDLDMSQGVDQWVIHAANEDPSKEIAYERSPHQSGRNL